MLKRLILIGIAVVGFSENKAMLFDGMGDYVLFEAPLITSANFSVSIWYLQMEQGGGEENQATLYQQSDNATGCDHSNIILNAESRPWEHHNSFFLRSDNGCDVSAQAEVPLLGIWHHYVAVKSDSSIHLYIDGNLVAYEAFIQSGQFDTNIQFSTFGRHRHDDLDYGYFRGVMDDICVWSRALSAQEVNLCYTGDLNTLSDGMTAAYSFEDGTVTDETGNGNNGVLMGDVQSIIIERSISEQHVWGDLNNDGYLDVSDVVILIQRILQIG